MSNNDTQMDISLHFPCPYEMLDLERFHLIYFHIKNMEKKEEEKKAFPNYLDSVQ